MTCRYCVAKVFYLEMNSFCCLDEKIVLSEIPVPTELKSLYSDQINVGSHFKQYILSSNHIFALTYVEVNVDELTNGRNGIHFGHKGHYNIELVPYFS